MADAPYYSGRELCFWGAVLGVGIGVYLLLTGEPMGGTVLLALGLAVLVLGLKVQAHAERTGVVERERREEEEARERIRGWSRPKRLAYLTSVVVLMAWLVARLIGGW